MEGRGHLHVLPPVLLHCVSTFPFRSKSKGTEEPKSRSVSL